MLIVFLFNHATPRPVQHSFMGWSRFLLVDIGSSSIGYVVYPRWLNNSGLKSLHIGIYIYTDFKALWKQWMSHNVPFAVNNTTLEDLWQDVVY
ncbi:hypothetical protein ACTXT7_013398 [Hymenolepis weldensis]